MTGKCFGFAELAEAQKAAHNPKVVSSNLAPATNNYRGFRESGASFFGWWMCRNAASEVAERHERADAAARQVALTIGNQSMFAANGLRVPNPMGHWRVAGVLRSGSLRTGRDLVLGGLHYGYRRAARGAEGKCSQHGSG